MSDNVYQFLLSKFQQQIQNTSTQQNNGWFDALIVQLRDLVNKSDLADPEKAVAVSEIDVLVKNQESLVELGTYGFSLFLYQIGFEKPTEATETYIQALSNPDDLIALINSGTDGVIQAKRHLEQLKADAISLAEELGMAAIKALLPFLISLIVI